jgi:hypothetical protein
MFQMIDISKNCFVFQKIKLSGDAIILITTSPRGELFGISATAKVLFLIVKLHFVPFMTASDYFGICGTACFRAKIF